MEKKTQSRKKKVSSGMTARQRKNVPTSKFGLPKERKYPMQDRSHAANAKARAKQQYNKGNLSAAGLKKIQNKADKVLYKGKKKDKK